MQSSSLSRRSSGSETPSFLSAVTNTHTKPQHQQIYPFFSSYLLQLSTPGSHEHHGVFSIGVGGHGSHALGPVLVQRVSLDHTQASQRLVQHQAAEIISDLLRLQKTKEELINKEDWPFNSSEIKR